MYMINKNSKINVTHISSSNTIEYKQIVDNIRFIFKTINLILLFSSIIEICFFPSIYNVYFIINSIICVSILRKFHLTTYKLLYYPVSTIAIFMYILFFAVLPLPATLLELKPVSYNLHNPIETFSNVLLLECILILTQNIYIKIFGKRNIVRNLLLKTSAFSKLSFSELWFLIIISVALHVYIIMSRGLYVNDDSNVYSTLPSYLYILNLLIGGFTPMIFLFLFRKFNVIKNESYKIYYIPIIMIAVLLFFVGIATNMRTSAIQTVSVAFFLFIYYWIFFLSKKSFNKKFIFIGCVVAYFFLGPFMNISKAMVNVRNERTGLSGTEVLEMTFSNMNKNDTNIDETKVYSYLYSEEYLSNDILQRFCSIKILDETLYRAKQLGYSNSKMIKHLDDTILSFIPGFIKDILNLKVNKIDATLTDRLAYESRSTSQLGGAKIGTLQGLGLALYGWWYIPIIMLVYIIIFYLMDSLLYFNNGRMSFSWIFLCNCVTFCYWFSDRHYYTWEYRFLMRSFIEMVIFTTLTIYIIKKLPFLKH